MVRPVQQRCGGSAAAYRPSRQYHLVQERGSPWHRIRGVAPDTDDDGCQGLGEHRNRHERQPSAMSGVRTTPHPSPLTPHPSPPHPSSPSIPTLVGRQGAQHGSGRPRGSVGHWAHGPAVAGGRPAPVSTHAAGGRCGLAVLQLGRAASRLVGQWRLAWLMMNAARRAAATGACRSWGPAEPGDRHRQPPDLRDQQRHLRCLRPPRPAAALRHPQRRGPQRRATRGARHQPPATLPQRDILPQHRQERDAGTGPTRGRVASRRRQR